MLRILAIASAFALLSALTSHAQPAIDWEQTYGTSALELGGSVVQTADGGFAILGSVLREDLEDDKLMIVRTDADGDELWSRTYDADSDQTFVEATALAATSDGGLVFMSQDLEDHKTVGQTRLDADGNVLWTRHFGEPFGGSSGAERIISTSDGGYVWTGELPEGQSGLVKTNASGDVEWRNNTSFGEGMQGEDVVVLPEGGFAVLAAVYESDSSFVYHVDDAGNNGWVHLIEKFADASKFAYSDDGDFVMVGRAEWGDESKFRVVKMSEEGQEFWRKDFSIGGFSDDLAVRRMLDGDFLLTGVTGNADDFDDLDGFMLLIDGDGEEQWRTTMDWDAFDVVYDALQTPDGSVVLSGAKGNFAASEIDIWLVKTEPTSINVAVEHPDDVPHSALSVSAFPNPSSGRARIDLELPVSGRLTLAVYDLLGRRITDFTSTTASPGPQSFEVDLADHAAGLYFVRIDLDGTTTSKPLLLTE